MENDISKVSHSLCYIRSDHKPDAVTTMAVSRRLSNKVYSSNDKIAPVSITTSFFRSIFGASVSTNTSMPPSTAVMDSSSGLDRVSPTFESSDSFASIPLQLVPRGLSHGAQSDPIKRGFLSGLIERVFLSDPIDRGSYSLSSGLVISKKDKSFTKSFILFSKPKKIGLVKAIKRVFSRSFKLTGSRKSNGRREKQGEGKMHVDYVVVSLEKGGVFVGIYDGFNGPDAPNYLLSNLYNNIHQELERLLWVMGSVGRRGGIRSHRRTIHTC